LKLSPHLNTRRIASKSKQARTSPDSVALFKVCRSLRSRPASWRS
jgi:hypothetical protein